MYIFTDGITEIKDPGGNMLGADGFQNYIKKYQDKPNNQRLKIMVADKMHSRATGKDNYLVRQPAAGRANNGGLRIGEMERDSILSHGISQFLNESVMERSDKFNVQIDTNTGLISYDDSKETKANIQIPYAMKLLLQELESMGIAPRLITDKNIDNVTTNNENSEQYVLKICFSLSVGQLSRQTFRKNHQNCFQKLLTQTSF